jgi:hypothetical protein
VAKDAAVAATSPWTSRTTKLCPEVMHAVKVQDARSRPAQGRCRPALPGVLGNAQVLGLMRGGPDTTILPTITLDVHESCISISSQSMPFARGLHRRQVVL